MPPNATVIIVCLCCHGSIVSIATNGTMVCCLTQGIHVLNMKYVTFKQQSKVGMQSVHDSKSYHGLLLPQVTHISNKNSHTLKQQNYKHITLLP